MLSRSVFRGIIFVRPLVANSGCTCSINHIASYSTHQESKQRSDFIFKCTLGVSTVCIGYAAFKIFKGDTTHYAAETPFGKRRENLPNFTIKELSEHSSREKGIWVAYKHGVYDITEFIDMHPGGDKILMAAGGSVEPFWMIYGVHKQEHILEMLENYRIGNLDETEMVDMIEENDPYGNEPRRHPILKPSSLKPYNAEPPPEILVESFITPQDVFYVRNHLPVPEVDLKTYVLEIGGAGLKCKTINLDDIKKLPKYTVTASVQCAGNRRSEMSQVKAVKGLGWGHAAIGNATWTGCRLRDLLLALGVAENTSGKHVQFEGLDCDPSGTPYGASIPVEKALDPRGDVLLAYEMNGEPLSRDHGFPLRAIVPGIVGARNVKWLSKILISTEESDSHWQQNDYKGFSPSTDWDTVDWKSAPAIQELPVTSAICSPAPGEKVTLNSDSTVTVKGYAWSGGGRGIVRVDVTADCGKTWHTAKLTGQKSPEFGRSWAWTLWSVKLPIPKPGSFEIWSKAVDSAYNTQPETFSNTWNLRGVLANAYHRIKITVSH